MNDKTREALALGARRLAEALPAPCLSCGSCYKDATAGRPMIVTDTWVCDLSAKCQNVYGACPEELNSGRKSVRAELHRSEFDYDTPTSRVSKVDALKEMDGAIEVRKSELGQRLLKEQIRKHMATSKTSADIPAEYFEPSEYARIFDSYMTQWLSQPKPRKWKEEYMGDFDLNVEVDTQALHSLDGGVHQVVMSRRFSMSPPEMTLTSEAYERLIPPKPRVVPKNEPVNACEEAGAFS
jgi:hypothetical protein